MLHAKPFPVLEPAHPSPSLHGAPAGCGTLLHWSPSRDKAGTPSEWQGPVQPPAWKHPHNGTGISQNSFSTLGLGRVPEVQGWPKDESEVTGFKYPVLVTIPFFNKSINSSFPLDLCMQGKALGRPACPENKGQHDKGSRPQSSPTCFPPAGEGALCSVVTAGDNVRAAGLSHTCHPSFPCRAALARTSEFQATPTNTGILCS